MTKPPSAIICTSARSTDLPASAEKTSAGTKMPILTWLVAIMSGRCLRPYR